MTGFFLLKKAGYDPEWMVTTLELLKEIYTLSLKEDKNMIPYFQSHPTPNERLSKIPSNKQEWYLFLAKMESVFADIQLSTNLANCIYELDLALQKYPDNVDLLRAKAVAEHKAWLNTVSLREQELKSILDMPAFRDEMLADIKKGLKRTKEIPGDKKLFYTAKDSYAQVFKKSSNLDAGFLSNYSTLLAYDPDLSNEALRFAEEAFFAESNIQTTNNLGVVYWLTDNKPKAKEILGNLASQLEASLKIALLFASLSSEIEQKWKEMKLEFKIRQSFDHNYVNEQITPILNYSLLLYSLNEKENGKEIANFYLNALDASSSWAKRLSDVYAIGVNNKNDVYEIEGITIGTKEKDLYKKWYMPDPKHIQEIKLGEGAEQVKKKIIYFSKQGAIVHLVNGSVQSIFLKETSSTKLNSSVSVGDSQKKIFESLGTPSVNGKSYSIYSGKQTIKIYWQNQKAKEIIIF